MSSRLFSLSEKWSLVCRICRRYLTKSVAICHDDGKSSRKQLLFLSSGIDRDIDLPKQSLYYFTKEGTRVSKKLSVILLDYLLSQSGVNPDQSNKYLVGHTKTHQMVRFSDSVSKTLIGHLGDSAVLLYGVYLGTPSNYWTSFQPIYIALPACLQRHQRHCVIPEQILSLHSLVATAYTIGCYSTEAAQNAIQLIAAFIQIHHLAFSTEHLAPFVF